MYNLIVNQFYVAYSCVDPSQCDADINSDNVDLRDDSPATGYCERIEIPHLTPTLLLDPRSTQDDGVLVCCDERDIPGRVTPGTGPTTPPPVPKCRNFPGHR